LISLNCQTIILCSLLFSGRRPFLDSKMGRKFANGCLCFGPASFVSAAFILSQFASRGCKFIDVDQPDSGFMSQLLLIDQVDYLGVFCFQTENGVNYAYASDAVFSSEHALARNMAYATTIMGAIAWCFYVLASCLRFPPPLWLLVSSVIVATCVCEGLNFKWFSSNECDFFECDLATSSRCGISACVFWFISAIMTYYVFKDSKDHEGGEGGN